MLTLRLLDDEDMPSVTCWLHKEHVKRRYEIPELGITIHDWLCEISARKEAFHWITYNIVLFQDKPIGLCLFYRCADSDEDYGTLPIAGSYGIDYLIGEEAYLGKGLGKALITLLVDRIFAIPDAQRVTADIANDNAASRQALLSCGFVLVDADHNRYMKGKASNALERLL